MKKPGQETAKKMSVAAVKKASGNTPEFRISEQPEPEPEPRTAKRGHLTELLGY